MAAVKLKRYFVFSSVEKNRINGVCQLCHRNYRDLNGIYSNFIKHLKRKHPVEHNKAFKQPDDEDSMDDIESNVDETISVEDPSQLNSKQTRIMLSMAKNVIVKCNLPFSIAENPAFQEFLKDCYPKWRPISSRKLKSDVILSMKNRVYKTIHDALEKVDHLTLTIDAWSDRRGRGFLGVTCHFIDEKMAPRAFLIDFVRMKSPHTSETIQQLTECILDRLNIKHKVYRIITDNASTMLKAYKFGLVIDDEHNDRHLNHGNVDVDDDYFDSEQMCLDSFIQADVLITDRTYECKRLSCFAHTLQLAIRDGLGKDPNILRMINKCKLFARLTHKIAKIADILDRINKHIERPNITRWSSEFMLIKSILSIDKSDIESIGKSLDENIQFSSSEFKLMCEIVHVLEPFHLISTKCQSEKTVNISLVVPSIVHLWYHLQTTEEDLVFCRGLVQQLKFSLQGRFAGIMHRLYQTDIDPNEPFSDPLYFMAALLDPAFKFFWIKCLQLPVNAENRLKHHIIQLVLDEIMLHDSQFPVNDSNQSTHTLKNIASRMSESGDTIKRIRLFEYDDFFYDNTSTRKSDHLDPSVEVDAYINDPIRATFSDYWCRSQLTSLKKLVGRIFSVQASSAPIERVFSQAGLIFSTRRTRMNEQLFRDTIFLKANQSLL